jgi:hypothetical protein
MGDITKITQIRSWDMDFLQNPKKLIQCFRKPHFPVALIRRWPEIDALHGQSPGRFVVVATWLGSSRQHGQQAVGSLKKLMISMA